MPGDTDTSTGIHIHKSTYIYGILHLCLFLSVSIEMPFFVSTFSFFSIIFLNLVCMNEVFFHLNTVINKHCSVFHFLDLLSLYV